MSEQRQTTVGALTADDLGSVVALRDGGATYEGVLDSVQHNRALFADQAGNYQQGRSQVILKAAEWRHIGYHPAHTPCTVSPSSPVPGTPGEREEGDRG